ncbi:MAG: alpha/beta fold hydrolase [Candidatus Thorarchaeota archaeon]|nr:alpha/beta fold hydrolase [Candidatus Thorarchaeota archaeon]
MTEKPRGVERRPDEAEIGFLLVHGFCGNPLDMKSLGEFLEENGIASFTMILAGHETSPEDLAKTTIEDWYQSAAAALEYVRTWSLKHIYVAGLSLGGLVTLDLAYRQPQLEGIVLLSPAIKVGGFLGKLVPLIRRFHPYRTIDTSYLTELYDLPRRRYEREPLIAIQRLIAYAKRMQEKLPEIKTPTLIIQSGADKTVNPEGAKLIYDRIGIEDKELHYIEGAEHVITCHPKRSEAYPLIMDWIRQHALE